MLVYSGGARRGERVSAPKPGGVSRNASRARRAGTPEPPTGTTEHIPKNLRRNTPTRHGADSATT